MSECLHCDINELVRQHVERGTNDLAEIAAMVPESLADLVLLAPEQDRANLLAHALPPVAKTYLEESGPVESGSSATH